MTGELQDSLSPTLDLLLGIAEVRAPVYSSSFSSMDPAVRLPRRPGNSNCHPVDRDTS